jgi:hypothetical protein
VTAPMRVASARRSAVGELLVVRVIVGAFPAGVRVVGGV